MTQHAFHGGAFFDAVGVGFDHLDRNEDVVSADVLDAWYDPAPNVLESLARHLPWLVKTSPPTHGEGLIEAICQARGVRSSQVLVGSGTSSLMYLAFPKIVRPGGKAVLFDPMYGEYPHILGQVMGLETVWHRLDIERSFAPDERTLAEQCSKADLIVIVQPNSPTGNDQRRSVEIAMDHAPAHARIWVDETYVDFTGAGRTLEPKVVSDSRLIVAKSMSKFYALSGVRVGYLVADETLVQELQVWSPPWSVGLIAQVAAVEALRASDYYEQMAQETARLREELSKALASVPGVRRVFDSVANFLLLELVDPVVESAVLRCRQHQVFVRDCASLSPRFDAKYLRVAVKDERSNARIVDALTEALGA